MSNTVNTRNTVTLDTTKLPRLARAVAAECASRRLRAFFVGGLVRDTLAGRPTRDIDIAVAGDSRALASGLAVSLEGRLVTLDEGRGIFRTVVTGDDVPWVVDVTSYSGDIESDLAHRDFTVDAMAIEVGAEDHATVVDPFGGTTDLDAKVIRAVGPNVFRDDAARLMRAPRLAAQMGFQIEPGTADSIRRDARLVTTVAAERIRDEFLKILAEEGASDSLHHLDDLGLLVEVLPELAPARGVAQPKEHYWDVLEHCIQTVGRVERVLAEPSGGDGFADTLVPRFDELADYFESRVGDGCTRATLLKLTGLLHDIAKPETKTVEDTGRIRFLGHNEIGAATSACILSRLRFSSRTVDMVRRMVSHHLRPSQLAPPGKLPSARAVFRYYRDLGDVAIDTLYLNMADYMAARGPMLESGDWHEHCDTIRHIMSTGPTRPGLPPRPRLVSGHDIMTAFALRPGPQIGQLLELVEEARAAGEINNKVEALSLVRFRISAGLNCA